MRPAQHGLAFSRAFSNSLSFVYSSSIQSQLHFTLHCLRHTFASIMLQEITLTVDLYGKWLPMGNKAAVNRLDNR